MVVRRLIIQVLFILDLVHMALLTAFVNSPEADASARAIISMAWGLVILWVFVGGVITLRYRENIRRRVQAITLDWRLKFVLFATLLALIEEAITTLMTNLAPLFGVRMGEAFITPSPNYFEVVLFHSVIVFIPMFIGWAWLLGRYDFHPSTVFLLFGLTGTFAEWIAFGVGTPLSLAFWVFIYGLMVYLPAYSVPSDRKAKTPYLIHYVLAVGLPLACSVPVALVVSSINQLRGVG